MEQNLSLEVETNATEVDTIRIIAEIIADILVKIPNNSSIETAKAEMNKAEILCYVIADKAKEIDTNLMQIRERIK